MPVEVIMPKVDMDMATGKVATWHVAEGERVEKGAPLFDIETDKAAMEVEAPASGILHHPVAEGVDIPIGQPVAWLYAEGEAVGEPPAAPSAQKAPAAEAQPAAPAAQAAEPPLPETRPRTGPRTAPQTAPQAGPEPLASAGDKARATPLARALARQASADLAGIAGSGPHGRIQARDVRAHLEAPRPEAPAMAPQAPSFTPETGPIALTRSRGGTGTPIVLIHGFASDSTSWAPLEAYLKHRPLIRIDLPCHGKSPKLRLPSFAALASELRGAFDSLEAEKFHLVGHSLGGALALALADTRARSVESLTLIAPAGLGPEINGGALNGICQASRTESLQPWLKTLVADERLISDGYARVAMAARADPAMRAAQTALAETLFPDGVQAFDLKAALERLDMPARILWGKNDAIIPWRHALRAPGNVALHLFNGIGHMPQFETPDHVGNLLRQLI